MPPPEIDPASGVMRMGAELIERAIEMSRASPRKRIILPFHRAASESPHRMLNALQPGTYIRPHRHSAPQKFESIVVLRGAIGYVTFDATGRVTGHFPVRAQREDFGVDTGPQVFHTFIALEPDTVVFEVKTGPYSEANDKDMAAWAPEEDDPLSAAYLGMLSQYFSESATDEHR